jgi:hypothetical protein
MEELLMPDDPISGMMFSTIYTRIASLITVNAGVLVIAQWAQAATEPLFQAWVGGMAQRLPETFPNMPREAMSSGDRLGQIASENHRNAIAAINATVLVFAHTVTDSAIDELLEISAKGVPERWRTDKEKFSVTLRELKHTQLEDYIRTARNRLVQHQKAKSLPEKVQYLFTISQCGPDAFGIKLDAKLLAEADLARHRIIHGAAFTEPLERLHGMLSATLYAASATILAVAYSCGYQHVRDHNGIVFNPIEQSATEE